MKKLQPARMYYKEFRLKIIRASGSEYWYYVDDTELLCCIHSGEASSYEEAVKEAHKEADRIHNENIGKK